MILLSAAILVIFFAFLRAVVVAVNLLSGIRLRASELPGPAKVSVLIPARNEEQNIGKILKQLTEYYPSEGREDGIRLEIIVYDDQSTDLTAEIVTGAAASDGRIKLIKGLELPDGWLGKNHACHLLAQEASGEWLLFLDSDVDTGPGLIPDSLAYARRRKLRLLSIFPKQLMQSPGEWKVVPLMNWILVSLLPMIMIRICKWTSFSAANGQFMLFRAEAYKAFNWHEQVKSNPVEDILICRRMKKKKLRVATLLGNADISCRMYSSYGSALNGFTKNTGQFFGNSLVWMIVFALLTTLGPFIIIASFLYMSGSDVNTGFYGLFAIDRSVGLLALIIYFALIFFIRIGVSAASLQSIIMNLWYWPHQHINFLRLIRRNIRFRRGQELVWKGRPIETVKKGN